MERTASLFGLLPSALSNYQIAATDSDFYISWIMGSNFIVEQ
jgi:hypothetical protein